MAGSDHVQKQGKYRAALHRSSYEEYKGNARSHLRRHRIYDGVGDIESALRDRVSVLAGKRKPPMTVEEYIESGGVGNAAIKKWGGTRYSLATVAKRWTLDYRRTIAGAPIQNFGVKSGKIAALRRFREVRTQRLKELGYEALVAQGDRVRAQAAWSQASKDAKEAREAYEKSVKDQFGTLLGEAGFPYVHNAHHVLPVEVFGDDKWGENVDDQTVATYLDILLETEYDINNPNNIIYLPQIIQKRRSSQGWMLEVHNLPNHADGHPAYDDMAGELMDEIYDRVKKIKSTVCESDPQRPQFLKNLKEMIIKKQTTLWKKILKQGAGPMPH